MSEYRRQLKIDKYNLENELMEQPQKYSDWATRAAEAETETKEAEKDYLIVKADKEKLIRSNPTYYGLDEKPLKDAVSQEAMKSKKVQKYYKKYLQAQHNEKILKVAEKSFAQRKSMLTSLVAYITRMYTSDPYVPREEKGAMSRATQKNIKDEMKRRRKIRRKR